MDFLQALIPKIAYAADSPIRTFVGKINRIIINPLIVLMFSAALIYFLYGAVNFILHADDAEERQVGQSHMLWGLVGMLIMFAVFTILKIIENTLGVSTPNPNIPL